MPKSLGSRAQGLVKSVSEYFEKEKEHGGPLIPLTAVAERSAAALGICVKTFQKIISKVKRGEELTSPKKKRQRTKSIVDIDGFTQDAIRNVIYEMYANKEHITIVNLKKKLREKNLFEGGATSLWKVIRNLGFKFNKDDPRRGLMELPHIALKRIQFLKKYMEYKREDLRQFVFLDETWIFQDGTIGYSWQNEDVRTVKKTKVGGKRYIVLHAGTENGFVPGAELVFSSNTKDPDYHGEMTSANFLKWFESQLLLNLDRPSVIVMDNASYHSTIINKPPTTNTKKADIQLWLKENNINFDQNMLKTELLQLVSLHKPPQQYEADQLAEMYGHTVLRLPPYHCIFNPIEHIWGITKTHYSKHVGANGNSAEKAVAMWKDSLSQVTAENWRNTVRHTEEEIKRWWEREVRFDNEDVAPLVINFQEDEDDFSESDDDNVFFD